MMQDLHIHCCDLNVIDSIIFENLGFWFMLTIDQNLAHEGSFKKHILLKLH